jgi:hypothetical protein
MFCRQPPENKFLDRINRMDRIKTGGMTAALDECLLHCAKFFSAFVVDGAGVVGVIPYRFNS